MKKLSLAAITATFAALEAVSSSAVAIWGNVKRLGWDARALLKVFAGMVLLTALGFASWRLWQHFNAPSPALPAAPAAVVQDVPKQTIAVHSVKAYAPSVKPKLGLPKPVQESSANVVLSATDLPKSKHERTLSAVLDTETGEVTNYIQEKPLPWFERSTSGSAGVYVGFKGVEPALRAELRQDLYSIKGVQISAIASADHTQSGTTDTFIGVGARYEW